ncbi:uncharacterized protein LOC124428601 [Vespa crabro]|uniref:uncharacterized protein LOC124428601 n=1 Tax=Vespa crabro TaxID=7445 RepID=UPI001F000944|nr:uncharacterized protein LOC124428601 [Vespa crabro]
MKSKCIQIYLCARWYTLRETEVLFKVDEYAFDVLALVLKYATIVNDGGRKDNNTLGRLLKELKKALSTVKDVNYIENELKEKIQNDKGSRNNRILTAKSWRKNNELKDLSQEIFHQSHFDKKLKRSRLKKTKCGNGIKDSDQIIWI